MTAARIDGDFSEFPEEFRDVLPYVYGELCELRSNWEVYRELFMREEVFTTTLAEVYGPTLGVLQRLLEESLFLSIGCLTDRNASRNMNLSMWSLTDRVHAWNPEVASEMRTVLDGVEERLSRIRKHRHKRLAHFDLSTSLGLQKLPKVTYQEIRETMEALEKAINVVEFHVRNTTFLFDLLKGHDITGKLEASAFKAKAYDDLVNRGVIDRMEWRRIRAALE